MIRLTNIHKSFNDNEVLKGVSLEVQKGDVLTIIGPSGSGKTTFYVVLIFWRNLIMA